MPNSSDDPRSIAVSQLQALGLSTYAARTFVALTSLGDGTAQDVSEAVDVPRTRVYDAASELQQHGLVDVQHSTPKRFWAISSETAGRHFDREYTDRIHRLVDALDSIEPRSRTHEQRGVWTVIGRDPVTNRILEFVENATEEIVFMSVEDGITDGILRHVSEASSRGVSIKLGSMSGPVEEELREQVPAAEFFDSLWEWTDTSAGRMLMVDQTHTLVSVLPVDDERHSDRSRTETAIWGSGENNSLVVVLKLLFTWRLNRDRD